MQNKPDRRVIQFNCECLVYLNLDITLDYKFLKLANEDAERVCFQSCLPTGVRGSHVTITHEVLDLTVQCSLCAGS